MNITQKQCAIKYSDRIELVLEQLVIKRRFAFPRIGTFCQLLKRKVFLNHRTFNDNFYRAAWNADAVLR